MIVGGGIGVPPMYFLAKMLKDENDITFVLGFRSKSQIILENELKKYGDVLWQLMMVVMDIMVTF